MKKYIESYKSKLSVIAKSYSATEILFSENSFDVLDAFPNLNFSQDVSNYLKHCIPLINLEVGNILILSSSRIKEEARNLIPGIYVSPFGFIPIAVYYSGDPYVVDTCSGKIYSIEHGRYDDRGIAQGWDSTCTKMLPSLQIDRDNIIATAEDSFDDIFEFLYHAAESC